MQVLDMNEVRAFCDERDIGMTHDGLLYYKHKNSVSLKIEVPEQPEKVTLLALLLLGWKEELNFHGSLLWLQSFDIGSPQVDRVGWRAIEQMRRGYGELRSIETAGGHMFRCDELLDANAFIALSLLFRWSIFMLHPSGEYFVYVDEGETAYFVGRTQDVLATYSKFLEYCGPESKFPSYYKRFDSSPS